MVRHMYMLSQAVDSAYEDTLFDCEIRDWEKFSLLPQATQQAVLEVIRSGKVPKELQTLMRKLKDTDIVVCT